MFSMRARRSGASGYVHQRERWFLPKNNWWANRSKAEGSDMAAASKSPMKSKVAARPIADFNSRIDANPPVCPLVHGDQDSNSSFEGVVDLNSVLPLVERLIASATK